MIRTNNLWAPVVTAGRKPWIIWTCVRSTRKDAKAAYLEGFPEKYHKEHLARVKFVKVFVAANGIKE
jgi:hypothetical protein